MSVGKSVLVKDLFLGKTEKDNNAAMENETINNFTLFPTT